MRGRVSSQGRRPTLKAIGMPVTSVVVMRPILTRRASTFSTSIVTFTLSVSSHSCLLLQRKRSRVLEPRVRKWRLLDSKERDNRVMPRVNSRAPFPPKSGLERNANATTQADKLTTRTAHKNAYRIPLFSKESAHFVYQTSTFGLHCDVAQEREKMCPILVMPARTKVVHYERLIISLR